MKENQLKFIITIKITYVYSPVAATCAVNTSCRKIHNWDPNGVSAHLQENGLLAVRRDELLIWNWCTRMYLKFPLKQISKKVPPGPRLWYILRGILVLLNDLNRDPGFKITGIPPRLFYPSLMPGRILGLISLGLFLSAKLQTSIERKFCSKLLIYFQVFFFSCWQYTGQSARRWLFTAGEAFCCWRRAW